MRSYKYVYSLLHTYTQMQQHAAKSAVLLIYFVDHKI